MSGLAELRARVAVGAAIGDRAGLPPAVRRAVELAAEVGAPLGPELDRAVALAEERAELADAVRVATAPARAVAGALTLAPLVLVPVLGRLLGVDLVAFYATPAGTAIGAAALVAHVAGVAWVRVVVRGGTRPGPGGARWVRPAATGLAAAWLWHPLVGVVTALVLARRRARVPVLEGADEVVDLVAVAVRGGLAPSAALRRAVAGLDAALATDVRRLAFALEAGTVPAELPAPLDRLADEVVTAGRWGAPVAPALVHLAGDLRREERTRALEAAARLPALLTVPTALLILPASVAVVAAPIVAEALASLGG